LRFLLPEDEGARRRRDRWLAAVFVLVAAILVVRAASEEDGVLARNQAWGARFLAGADPYLDPVQGRREHGPYPPSFALVAAPLALLPTTLARIVWAALQVGALVFFLRLLRRRTQALWPALVPHAPALYALALLLVSRYLLRDMAGGGGNLIYAALLVGGVDLALRGREWRAGLPIAASLVLKPNLLLFLVFLALRGRWRAVASALGASACLVALPGLHFGPAEYTALSARWARDVVAYARLDDLHTKALVPEGLPPAEHGMNQSLCEAVHRLLRPPGDSGAYDVHVLDVSPRAASWIARGSSLALLALAMLAARRARGPRAEWLAGLAFLPLALLCSPVTWKAHHVVLLPVFHALLCCAVEPGRRAYALGWFLAGYWFVCDLLSKEIVGDAASDWLQAAALVTWGDVALVGILYQLTRRSTAA
jgi:alpha-1,2-mannosyltransferase